MSGKPAVVRKRGAFRLRLYGPVALVAAIAGCIGAGRSPEEIRVASAWVDPDFLEDVGAPGWDGAELFAVAERLRSTRRPPKGELPPKRTVLAISGGGSYGAFSAGVLCGWTETGTRPTFDVVTGISTGALIAPFAFLGPAYDTRLRSFYTTISDDTVLKKHGPLKSLLSASFADNAPLRGLISRTVTPDLMREIAVEHQKGRRLYVGTTDLEGRRPVVWDVGAIACRGTAQDRELIVDVLLGSAAIPGFFPPTPITVQAGGRTSTERHVDGGVSMSLFFVPPFVAPEARPALPRHWLYGSDLYMLVAGKLYSDPEAVPRLSLKIAGSSISTVLYAQTRGDLQRLFTVSMLMGMNYHLASIPQDYPAPSSCTDFAPAGMRAMFEEGLRQVRAGTVWRHTPPGIEKQEAATFRTGTRLVDGGPTPAAVGAGLPVLPRLSQLTPEGIRVPLPPNGK